MAEWRKKQPLSAQWHDLAVEKFAEYLKGKDLFVIHPKRMTTREEKQVERTNDEFFGLYLRLREEGKRKTEAVETAAVMCGYGPTRAWEIVRLREGKAS